MQVENAHHRTVTAAGSGALLRQAYVDNTGKSQCRPCPVRTQCTTTADSARTVGFPPRELRDLQLRDLQLRVRAEQQTPEWKTRYAVRSGVEGTVNEFAHGYGMRRCRYRGHGKAHVPPTDCLPELPRPARDTPTEVLADPGQLTSANPRSSTESSSDLLD